MAIDFHTDEDLMKAIKDGSISAFDSLYHRYGTKVFNFSYSILKSVEEAENITQDVFLNLWYKREKIENSPSLKAYIFTIAYNSSISVIRRKLREEKYIDHLKYIQDFTENSVDLQIEFRELDEKLKTIIDSLPDRQRQIYLLHRVDGLKYSEIADRLNISINTIENHMSRALRLIREKISLGSILIILYYHLFL